MKVMGTTGVYEVGQAVARKGQVVGHVIREATQDEWFAENPNAKNNFDKYPDSASLFTFPRYYIYE